MTDDNIYVLTPELFFVDDHDNDLFILTTICSSHPAQDNDPLNRIVTVLVDIGEERTHTGAKPRYGTKFPLKQVKLRDVDLRFHRIVNCD